MTQLIQVKKKKATSRGNNPFLLCLTMQVKHASPLRQNLHSSEEDLEGPSRRRI